MWVWVQFNSYNTYNCPPVTLNNSHLPKAKASDNTLACVLRGGNKQSSFNGILGKYTGCSEGSFKCSRRINSFPTRQFSNQFCHVTFGYRRQQGLFKHRDPAALPKRGTQDIGQRGRHWRWSSRSSQPEGLVEIMLRGKEEWAAFLYLFSRFYKKGQGSPNLHSTRSKRQLGGAR